MLKLAIKNLFNSLTNSILLSISIIISILCFSVGVEYINYFYKCEMDKSILSNHSDKISINFKENIKLNTIIDFINSNNSSTIISGEIPLLMKNKRVFLSGININKNSDINFIPLVKGKSLSKDNIVKKEKVALVGYAIKDLVTNSNGKDCIKIKNELYSVLGYIGRDTNSYWNGSILIPITSLPSSVTENKFNNFEYLFLNKGFSQNEVLRAKNYFNKNFLNSSVLEYFNSETLSKILYNKRTFLISIGILILISLINIINFSYNWCKKNARNLSILVLLGYKKNNLIKVLALSFIFITIPSFFIGALLSMSLETILCNTFYISFKFKIENLYTGCIFSIIILLICCFINYVYIITNNLAKELKE